MAFGLMGVGMKYVASVLALLVLSAAPALADDDKSAKSTPDTLGVFQVQPLIEGDLNWYQGYASETSDSRDNFVVSTPVETENFGLNWSSTGRWGLTLDVTRRTENPVLPQEEIDAGAYFQVTPRLRLGGGIRFRGDDVTDTNRWTGNEDRETDVRIESAFSF